MSPGARAVSLPRAVLKTQPDAFSWPSRGRLANCNEGKQMAARATAA